MRGSGGVGWGDMFFCRCGGCGGEWVFREEGGGGGGVGRGVGVGVVWCGVK